MLTLQSQQTMRPTIADGEAERIIRIHDAARFESAPFLTQAQKRDILHDNAVRFLRLDRR
ncbi:MAG: hypothetical protein ABIQ52_02340 [Vicinamibacterales bacterium]